MTNSVYYDKHHLCYPRATWNFGLAKKLRNFPYLSVEVDRDTIHQPIHAHVPFVPVPTSQDCAAALRQLYELREDNIITDADPIEKRLSILCGIFQELDPDVAHAFEEQLKVVCRFKALAN